MKHIFIVNPAAGTGNSDTAFLPELQNFLKNTTLDFEIHRTLNKEEIGSYVRQRAQEGGEVRFYACGGDGTLNDVVGGMAGFDNAQLSVYPCGTGNDFVRNFKHKEYFRDLARLTAGEPMDCDLIRYNGSYAINMFNIGVDCEVAARAAQIKSRLIRGSMAYLAAAAEILPQNRTYRLSYEYDGNCCEEELMLAAIANGQCCGGGFHSSPCACINDGLLDITLVRPLRGLKMIRMLAKYRQGRHFEVPEAAEYIRHIKCRTFRIRPIDPVRFAIDGEISDMVEIDFECLPKAVRFAVPEGCEAIACPAENGAEKPDAGGDPSDLKNQ